MKSGDAELGYPSGSLRDKLNPFKILNGLPRSVWLGGLFIIGATLIAYGPVFSAGFIWDDDDYVMHNQTLRDWNGLRQLWFNPFANPQYYPLVHTTFWLEYHLWGLHPLGFHLVNVLLHIAGALLLWRLLEHLKLPGAWLAAAFFALHPVQVESVAWITERKNVLSAVFYFMAALAYLRFARTENEPERDKNRRHFYVAALCLFVSALLSKTVTCSLPAALLLVFWWKNDRLRRQDILPLVPFFLIGIAFGLVTSWIEKHHAGALGVEWSLTFADRCLVAGRALCFYASKLIYPVHLTFIYPRWEIASHVWWQWLFPATVIGLVAGLWLARPRIGKGPLVCVLFFAGTLFPALGFVDLYPMRFSFVADHFQYLACIGLLVLFAAGLSRAPRVVVAGLLLLLMGLTWQQAGNYRTIEILWRDTLSKNPQCWLAHNDLGMVLAAQGKLSEAENHYQTALDLKPSEERIHYNLANLLVRTGNLDEAIAQYQQALELTPANADFHNNLGSVLLKLHRNDEAIVQFQLAIREAPGLAHLHYNLGNALAAVKQFDDAVAEYQLTLKLDPGMAPARNRLRALGVEPLR